MSIVTRFPCQLKPLIASSSAYDEGLWFPTRGTDIANSIWDSLKWRSDITMQCFPTCYGKELQAFSDESVLSIV
jgi:hypothetical protein